MRKFNLKLLSTEPMVIVNATTRQESEGILETWGVFDFKGQKIGEFVYSPESKCR